MKDVRLWEPLVRYLRSIQFFPHFFEEEFVVTELSHEYVGHLLNCMAIELKTAPVSGTLAHVLVGSQSWKFHEILSQIEFSYQSMEVPHLEFFDSALVLQVSSSSGCKSLIKRVCLAKNKVFSSFKTVFISGNEEL